MSTAVVRNERPSKRLADELGVSAFGSGGGGGGGGGGVVPGSIVVDTAVAGAVELSRREGDAPAPDKDGGGERSGFDKIGELIMGNVGSSLEEGVGQWGGMGPEERDAAVRWVETCAESC